MMATNAATSTLTSAEAPATPADFTLQLRRVFIRDGAHAAAAFFEQHGRVMTPYLSSKQQTRVEEIMHIVDTITGWKPPADTRSILTAATGEVNGSATSSRRTALRKSKRS